MPTSTRIPSILRPFASGALPISWGVAATPMLLGGGFAIVAAVSMPLVALLGLYVVGTTAYTFVPKRRAVVDVTALAGLYTVRVLGGSGAIGVCC